MLRMAVVGLGMGGSHGARVHEYGKKHGNVEYAAMCDLDGEKLKTRAKLYKEEIGATPTPYQSVEEMLKKEKLDGVIISTPSGTHHKVAKLVSDAGVNLLIDKPVDITKEAIDVIEKSVKASGVTCGVVYQNRLTPIFNGLKKVIDDKLLGRPLICDFRMKWYRSQEYYDAGGWRGTWKMDGGGSIMNQGIHCVDILCWLFGKPKTVVGEFAKLNHKIETEDWTGGVIEFESGVRSTITTTTCAAPKKDYNFFDYHAENGSIYLKQLEVIESSIENLNTINPPKFDHPVDDFIDSVLNKRQPIAPLNEARRSVDLILALYQSAKEGRRITL